MPTSSDASGPTPGQIESAAFLDALPPDQVERLRQMAERHLAEPPVPDSIYGWTRYGHVDHLGLYKTGSGLWRSRCGRWLPTTSLLPMEGRTCSRCIEAMSRSNHAQTGVRS